MGSVFAQALSENERSIRDRFVEQYLEDYDRIAAMIRCGYQANYAKDYALRFMSEPYVLNRIRERESELGISTDLERHKAKMIKKLYSVMDSPLSSGTAKVSAVGQLSKILGLDAPVKTQTDVTLKSTGVDLSHLSVAELEAIKNQVYGAQTPVH